MLTVIRIGSFSISTYWVMLLLGTVGMCVYAWRFRSKYRLSGIKSTLFALILTVVGFMGAKLLYILENISKTLEEGISLGGVSFFGSVFLIPLLMPLLGRLFGLRFRETMDICGPCVAIMICCMRIGCILQGCCGGWTLCVGDTCFQWPTQAIEVLFDCAIFLKLLGWHQKEKAQGKLYPWFMLLYSSVRFGIEFLRDTPKDWLWLSHGQWFALGAVVVAIVWIRIWNLKNNRVCTR